MDKDELISNVNVVIDKENDDLYYSRKTLELKKENDKFLIYYPNSEILIDLFSNIQNDEFLKNNFIAVLKEKISSSHEIVIPIIPSYRYISPTALCFYTLIRLGFIDDSIEAFENRYSSSGRLVNLFNLLLKEDYNYFDMQQLNKLLNKLRSIPTASGDSEVTHSMVISKIIENRYDILKKQIKGVNLEINLDKKSVTQKINYLGFNEEYNELLDEIDKYINTETSNVINSGMISNLRSFLENLFKDIANRLSEVNKEEIPKIEGHGEMGNIRNYLKNKLDLSDKDHKFINSFVDVLHSEGGHSFTSNREYFRLTRNIAVEIALFILSKFEKKVK